MREGLGTGHYFIRHLNLIITVFAEIAAVSRDKKKRLKGDLLLGG